MVDLNSFFGVLEKVGFFEIVLPWLLFFAIFLGLLLRTKVFGEERNLNSIIALAVSLFVVKYTPAVGTAVYYTQLFGIGGMIIAALFVFVLLLKIVGFDLKEIFAETEKRWVHPLIAILVAFIVYGIYSSAIGKGLDLNTKLGVSEDTWTLILVGIFILLVVWFASRGGGKEERKYSEEEVKAALAAQKK